MAILYNLTKLGPAEVWIVSTSVDSALADIDIVQGTLGYENQTTGLGNPDQDPDDLSQRHARLL